MDTWTVIDTLRFVKKKEIDEIESLIVKIVANEVETEKDIAKNGLADSKYLTIAADYCRQLDKTLLEQVTLSKYEVSKIFEDYLKHEKINEASKRILKKRLEIYFTGGLKTI